MNRRDFIVQSAKALAMTTIVPHLSLAHDDENFSFEQIPLPYSYEALEPHIDAMTMQIHYEKHHRAYIKNVNEALPQEKIKVKSEKELFNAMSKFSDKVRNNAGGAWNHNFFWKCLKPNGGEPTGKVAEVLQVAFGSVNHFKEQFSQAAMGQFGSGWAWLIEKDKKLIITSTPNQDNPLMSTTAQTGKPILALDVWEHAYYLKYQNKRADYVTNWWNIVNWDFVAKQLG